MKNSLALTIAMVVSLTLPSTHYAKEPAKKKSQEEAAPHITEVMTKEELQAYLKERGIPIITKENFKEPELVWEKTFDEPIREISDITEKGNCIAVSGPTGAQAGAPPKALLFINNKGEVRQRIDLGNLIENNREFFVSADIAKSGKYAAVFKVPVKEEKEKTIIFYYDEEGAPLWSKPIDEVYTSIISYNGETIALQEGNPRWSEEEWSPGNKNINKVRFYNSEGKPLSEYGGYRNFSQWALSDDGKSFAAFTWWMDDQNRERRSLIYLDVSTGKVRWEKSLKAKHWLDVGGPYSLTVSEKGSYVAAAVIAQGRNKSKSVKDDKEINILNKEGKLLVRVPVGKNVYSIAETGLLNCGSLKGLIDIHKVKGLGITGNPPYLTRFSGKQILEKKAGYADGVYRIVSIQLIGPKEDLLWVIPQNELNYTFYPTQDGRYLKVIKSYEKGEVKVLRFRIVK